MSKSFKEKKRNVLKAAKLSNKAQKEFVDHTIKKYRKTYKELEHI